MKPCASINAFFDSTFMTSVATQMQRVSDAGFTHLDMNFWDWSHDAASPFKKDDWKRWVEEIAAAAQRMQVTFTQAHAHVYNFYQFPKENPHEEQIRRSIEGAGMLGIPWIVLHPSQRPDYEEAGSKEKMLSENIAYFRAHAQTAAQWGVGLALENMSSAKSGLTTAEDLCQLIDGIGMDNVGACWDTGHANMAKVDQPLAIRTLGKRLHALHLADNHGVTDEHTAPYYGNIDWPLIARELHAIGYDGDCTFEAHNLVRPVPERCRPAAMHLMYMIGLELCSYQ